MSLDYYFEIEKYGTKEKKEKLHDLILKEFTLSESKETKLIGGDGLSIGLFIDNDEWNNDHTMVPNLTISFRVEKFHLREQGYILLRRVVQKIIGTIEADFRLIDEDENIFVKRESGKIFKMLVEHDVWQAGQ